MRKRIGALGLAAVLLLAMICPALAAGTKFVVKGPEEAPRKGETFTVNVELKDNPGFNVIQFTLTFDKEKMTCTEAEAGEVMGNMMAVTNPSNPKGAVVAGASVRPMTGDGVVAAFTFVAESDLTEMELGLAEIELGGKGGDPIPYEIEMIGAKDSGESPAVTPTPSEPDPVSPTPSRPDPEPAPADPTSSRPETDPAPGGNGPEPSSQPAETAVFTDTKGHWAESYIARATELGLFKGYPDGSFKPDLDVTRAQYVTVLYRMAGSPAVTGEAPFTDIADQSQEFRTAIAWGYENGYLNGKGEGIFDPSGPVTRQEAMKILFGYDGGVSEMETMFTATYDSTYTDSDQLASWGKPAMYWGVYKSIITGTSETTLSPNGTATRAQLAKILTVYYDQQNKS